MLPIDWYTFHENEPLPSPAIERGIESFVDCFSIHLLLHYIAAVLFTHWFVLAWAYTINLIRVCMMRVSMCIFLSAISFFLHFQFHIFQLYVLSTPAWTQQKQVVGTTKNIGSFNCTEEHWLNHHWILTFRPGWGRICMTNWAIVLMGYWQLLTSFKARTIKIGGKTVILKK